MVVVRLLLVLLPLAVLTGCEDLPAEARPGTNGGNNPVGEAASNRICKTVKAVATGFGEDKVTEFAHSNLDLVIDKVKDELSQKGAKSFSVEDRKAVCEDYIDLGGSLGREHKCHANARLCGKTG